MPEQETTEKKDKDETTSDMPVIRSPEYKGIYANSVRIIKTPWDFTLSFGALVEPVPVETDTLGTKARLVAEQRVSVSMSPQHTKVFALLLYKQITEWETRFGEMPVEELFKTIGLQVVEHTIPVSPKSGATSDDEE